MLSVDRSHCFVHRCDNPNMRERFATEIVLILPRTFVPITQNTLDQLTLGSDGMNDVVTGHAVCAAGASNVMDVEVRNGSAYDLLLLVIHGVMDKCNI